MNSSPARLSNQETIEEPDALHEKLHSGNLHGFIHLYGETLHDRWHNEFVAAPSACGSPPSFASGVCKTAHDAFHTKLDVFHDHAHGAFGVPQ